MSLTGLENLRVLSLESRRSEEVARLIRSYGGEPLVAPSLREVPLESNQPALDLAAALMRGEFDLVIFFTGAGVRALLRAIDAQHGRDEFLETLRTVNVAARGAKTLAALRELAVPIAVSAAEPSTWHELLSGLQNTYGSRLKGMRAAVQEYGVPNPAFVAALEKVGVRVLQVPVYQWALPEDLQPLREAVLAISQKQIDVLLLMNAAQFEHLLLVAGQMGCEAQLREGLNSTFIVSIGPTTSEELIRRGVSPDFEPSHPKMGFMVNETAQQAKQLLAKKRARTSETKQQNDASPIEFLHEIGRRMAAADQFHAVLERIVEFVASVVNCDSCFIYVLEQDRLVLRASKNPHADVVDHLDIRLGQGITGWVAEHGEPVAITSQALRDPRFKMVSDLPEDLFEAFLSVPILVRGKLVGVINLQHRQPYYHSPQEVRLISMIGFLVGAEIERARLESENVALSQQLEARKHIERAKGILQREFSISEDEAYRTMQRESRQRRKSMKEIAEAIILSDDIRRGRRQDADNL